MTEENKSPKSFREIFNGVESSWELIKGKAPIDYEGFNCFIEEYTVGLDETYPLKNEASVRFAPYIQLLHFTVAFNHFLYSVLTEKLTGRVIKLVTNGGINHASKDQEMRPDADLAILQIWRQRVFTLDNVARSFCIGREYQAFQQLRCYIESCQLLFVILTDGDILQRYLGEGLCAKEYRDLWWKYFTFSKMKKRIALNKKEAIDEENRSGLIYGDIRKSEPVNIDFFQKQLDRCNDYLHLNKNALLYHSYVEDESAFRIRGSRDWSNFSKSSLTNILEVVSYSTDWVQEAVSMHTNLFEGDELGATLSYYHAMLSITSACNGLYDFANEEE